MSTLVDQAEYSAPNVETTGSVPPDELHGRIRELIGGHTRPRLAKLERWALWAADLAGLLAEREREAQRACDR